jgi:putative ABC transport system permease protein
MSIGKRKKITIAELDRIRSRTTGPMRYFDLVRVSVREVLRKRRRYIGVIGSIALGMAGFIIIITMGNDLKKNFNNDLDLLGGATILNVNFETSTKDRQEWFREPTLDAIKRLPGVTDVTEIAFKSMAVTSWHEQLYMFNLVACQANYWSLFSFHPTFGRLFNEKDVESGARVCVVGQDAARQVFGDPKKAVGQMLNIDENLYTVVGILGGVRAGDRSQFVFLPLPTARARVEKISPVYSIYVRCASWDDVSKVAAAVPGVVKAMQIDRGLRVNVAWEALKQVKRIFWWVELFIYSSIEIGRAHV